MSDDTFQTLTATRLGDSAYEQIAGALMSGRLKPGARLTIRNLAELLGISTTPVRDAVMRLIQNKALEQRTLRDVRVPVLSERQFREIISIRIELEGMAAAKAATAITVAQIDVLEKLIAENERAYRDEEWDLASACNQKFHFSIVGVADLPVLRGILEALWLQTGPLVAGYYKRGGRAMIDEHYAIVDALKHRDGKAAARAMRRDVSGSIEGISAYVRELREATLKPSAD